MLNSLAAAINRGVAVSAINFFYVINYIPLLTFRCVTHFYVL